MSFILNAAVHFIIMSKSFFINKKLFDCSDVFGGCILINDIAMYWYCITWRKILQRTVAGRVNLTFCFYLSVSDQTQTAMWHNCPRHPSKDQFLSYSTGCYRYSKTDDRVL